MATSNTTRLLLDAPHGPVHGALWRRGFYTTVEGPIRSKANYRRGDSWSQQVAFAASVRAAVRAGKPCDWDTGDAAAAVADRPVVVAALVARALLDAGNLNKTVLDACQGDLFVTDAQVASVSDTVIRTRTDQSLICAFAQLAPRSGPRDVLAAQAQLVAELATLLATAECAADR